MAKTTKKSKADEIRKRIADFNDAVKTDVIAAVHDLVKSAAGHRIDIPEDGYLGYPVIYTVDERCSIMEFRGAMVSSSGRLSLVCEDGTLRSPRRVPTFELLQMLDHLEKAAGNDNKTK